MSTRTLCVQVRAENEAVAAQSTVSPAGFEPAETATSGDEAALNADVAPPPAAAVVTAAAAPRAGQLRSRAQRAASLARSARAASTYVHDELAAACDDHQYTCGASLMPDGHQLAAHVYCNEGRICAAALERALYSVSVSTLKYYMVDFDKSLCSMSGTEQLSKAQRIQQGCSGDVVSK
jgi:hypothetical protein